MNYEKYLDAAGLTDPDLHFTNHCKLSNQKTLAPFFTNLHFQKLNQ